MVPTLVLCQMPNIKAHNYSVQYSNGQMIPDADLPRAVRSTYFMDPAPYITYFSSGFDYMEQV